MANPTFKRNKELSGYDARRKVGDRVFAAHFAKSDKGWKIDAGDFMRGREWVKLSELKIDWSGFCEYTEVDPSVAPSAGPPAIGGPPPVGPPKLGGPPPVKKPVATGSSTLSPTLTPMRDEVIRGELTNGGIGLADFEVFLGQQGKLAGPVRNDFARCEECGMHISDWEKGMDGVIYPPCRCDLPEGLASDYCPDSLDPRMWGRTLDGAFRTLTPIGALDQVYNWMRLHPEQCSAGRILVEPFKSVQKVLYAMTGYAEFRPEVWGPK